MAAAILATACELLALPKVLVSALAPPSRRPRAVHERIAGAPRPQ
jgi:hypothetical protein